ncbi:MAG: Brp/Blh family beta-carotene 15,15'-dioxygenase [Halohasta sp.]
MIDGWLPTGEQAVEQRMLLASRVVLIALTVGFVVAATAGYSMALETQLGVYLFGMVAVNLPHGGYEHFSNVRRRGLPFGIQYVGLYLLGVGIFVSVLFVAPVAGLALALSVAIAKGGHGGLRVMDALVGTDHLKTRPQRALAALVRGGAVMIVPIYAWPETFAAFSTYMVNIFELGAFASYGSNLGTSRFVLAGLFGAAVGVHIGVGFVRAGGPAALVSAEARATSAMRSWFVDVAETLLLIVYFVAVPVVVAVGLYFPVWYSLRQSARASIVERSLPDPNPDEGVPPVLAGGMFLVGAVVTFGLAALLWSVVPNPLGGSESLLIGGVAFYSIFVSIIALPHVVVGGWWDREHGIWYVP